MRQQIDITTNRLLDVLHGAYGLPATGIEPLGLGEDSAAAVFRVLGQGGPWFVKLKRAAEPPAGARLARFLADRGFEAAVAPIRSGEGEVATAVDGWQVLVYPYLDAPTAVEAGLTGEQWVDYGRLLRALHEALPALDEMPALRDALPREAYASDMPARAAAMHTRLVGLIPETEAEARIASLWHGRSDEIGALVVAVESLSERLSGRDLPVVLCHADIHRYNVLVGAEGRLLFADWDEAMVSPRERDLMFILGGVIGREPVTAAEEAGFMAGYGPASIDTEALAYYRCLWALQDVVDFSERVWRPGLDDDARRDAARLATGIFAPGDEAEVALADLRRLGMAGSP